MSAPSNKKETILGLILSKLNAISSTGGNYNYTLTGLVTLNKTTAFESFGVNIQDNTESLLFEDSSSTIQDNDLTVDIAIAAPTKSDIDKLYKYEADILKCIGNNLLWDGNAYMTSFVSSVRNKVDQLGQKVGDLVITIKIQFRKTAWNL